MYPTQVIIDYNVLTENFKAVQSFDPSVSLAPVVKSDAYGHGLIPTSLAFIAGGAERLAVFRLEEAIQLRAAGITCPVWVLLGALPYEAMESVGKGFVLAVFDLEQAKAISDAAVKVGCVQDVHVAIDTGMGRLGFRENTFPAAFESIRKLPGLHIRGIISHVAKAAVPDHPVTMQQVAIFRKAVSMLPAECNENHLCASDAWYNRLAPELRFARPGICLYAEHCNDGMHPVTKDAMTVKTRLVSLKEVDAGSTISYGCIRTLNRKSRVAVAPIGYEDGYMRSLSNKGYALVRGKRAPLLGTICMSMTMLDVTDIDGVSIDDEAVFMGKQGDEKITVSDLSALANTTPHELLCAFGKHRK